MVSESWASLAVRYYNFKLICISAVTVYESGLGRSKRVEFSFSIRECKMNVTGVCVCQVQE